MMKWEPNLLWHNWIMENSQEGQVVGFDFSQYPAYAFDLRCKPIKEKGLEVKSTPNLVDAVWGDSKPARPCEDVKIFPAEFAGMNPFAKYPKMCEKLPGIDLQLVTALD